ncbi:MAG: hypothetical protein ACPGXK_16000, partial [Phycisphaerae bacterium]
VHSRGHGTRYACIESGLLDGIWLFDHLFGFSLFGFSDIYIRGQYTCMCRVIGRWSFGVFYCEGGPIR